MSGRKSKDERWLVAIVIVLCATCMQRCCVEGEPVVPCMFIMGDSTADNGNNNNLPTLAKANYRPYGIDSPTGPTGKFYNNRTQADFIAEFMGLPMMPPFANTSGSDILKGVNYASGTSGIVNETGKNLGENIELTQQISNHLSVTVPEINMRLGGIQQGKQYLLKCLYYVTIGSNDYLFNYFLTPVNIYNHTQYANLLIDQFTIQLNRLIGSGARKIVVLGLGPLGKTPYEMTVHGNNTEAENRATAIYDKKLKSLVDKFNNNTIPSQGAKFVFVNATAIFTRTPELVTGFRDRTTSCCPTLGPLCVREGTPCPNRSEYFFWDGVHPTSRVNRLFALSAYNGSDPSYTHPHTITQLVHS